MRRRAGLFAAGRRIPARCGYRSRGKIWYSAQRNGALGILDPATGQSREVKLGPKSSPHGVIQGPDVT